MQSGMYWEEDVDTATAGVPDAVVDLVFQMNCRTLPVDHAYRLSQAVQALLPWFSTVPAAGLHLIHGADSGNGWYRPEAGGEDLLYLSRRTRFVLRLPRERVEDARALSGQVLNIDGHALALGEASVRPLAASGTIYARYVVGRREDSEAAFLERVAGELRSMGIRFKKVLCGRSHTLATPDGEVFTRSVMLADLSLDDSFKLQQLGLGAGRKLGCGLFIPHKSLNKADLGVEGLR